VEAAATDFPWRELGELLIADGLLTEEELHVALAEQQSSGRLLGEILVGSGYVSAFSLARVLSRQHGVEVERPVEESIPAPTLATEPEGWRPLGRVLVELEFMTETQLERALALQRDEGGRLGEILVSRSLVSPAELAQALAEQHGIELDPQAESDVDAADGDSATEKPVYQVVEVRLDGYYEHRTEIYETENFLEAADYAVEFMHEHEPSGLEIQRNQGLLRETVWDYSASRARAIKAAGRELVGTFGFDPNRRFAPR
jgi:hypothetical protein